MKTPRIIALLAVPVVLAAAVVTATGAFAKSPTHQSAAKPAGLMSLAAVKLSAAGAAQASAPTTAAPAPAASEPAATESAAESAAEATSTEADAAGGHADDPNDPNADHQFDGEE